MDETMKPLPNDFIEPIEEVMKRQYAYVDLKKEND